MIFPSTQAFIQQSHHTLQLSGGPAVLFLALNVTDYIPPNNDVTITL